MRLLVVAEDYPTSTSGAMAFVHTRCVEYLERDKTIDLYVLSFKTQKNYTIDSVRVISLSSCEKLIDEFQFDILISHAPNVKHHMRFIGKYEKKFHDIVFFFHGHEALRIIKYYPDPYEFLQRKARIPKGIQTIYDNVKLFILKRTVLQLRKKNKIHLVFVSHWMEEQFFINTKIEKSLLDDITTVIYNSIQKGFEKNFYVADAPKKYDFVTIRGNLDGSKYGVDMICRLAENNPNVSFLLYGKGDYFQYCTKPNNLELREGYLSPNEMIPVLNECKCALMLSRLDAQGVMACEMASFGMPLITSDMPIFHEVFKGFDNVQFISNDALETDLQSMLENRRHSREKKHTFYAENTIQRELELYHLLIKNRNL